MTVIGCRRWRRFIVGPSESSIVASVVWKLECCRVVELVVGLRRHRHRLWRSCPAVSVFCCLLSVTFIAFVVVTVFGVHRHVLSPAVFW